ncbi:alginate export family protein [Arenibacter sp. M-2]|uniref:alginate export family protein n=1 Tax=unclassified Arenibacter TaxID=2615047 RepID=UPI000D775BC2|nr:MULTISPECIES: alginate export family protein [unclassified Arenibacter]MDL5512251.1 alginate export family protein [Arenibacter sp. M-2]PXX29995.1 alginate export protein [Arenibacter sp. ARW7G5Y1]
MKRITLLFNVLALYGSLAYAQFTLDGEFRPRTELRHGFGSLIADDVDAGFGVSTRLRLNAGYTNDAYQFYVSLQDVMVWGENRQLLPDDENNSFAVFEAWADINLGSGFSTKLGRQTLEYDDQRIMGSVGWTQQARNHDAAILKYAKENFQMDFGLAYSQDYDNPSGFQSVGNAYNTTGFFSYKTMQYLYLKEKWKNLNGSLLLLNNGFQNFELDGTTPDGISILQTLGTHIDFKKGSFGAALNAYLQTGERQGTIDVGGAYLLGLDINYKASAKVGLGVGMEIISGNDASTSDKTEAFFPLYGTNHKFNGFMDYFYVGNHANSVGLFDIHVSANFKLGEKSSLMVKALNFSGEQALPSGEKSLGTELDLVFSQAFNGYSLQLGYSQMFANDGMYELKGISEDASASNQNWAWAMLVIKPKFLNTTK